MNFFEHQERARRNTNRLVVLFLLAVVAIATAIYTVLRFALFWGEGGMNETGPQVAFVWWDPGMFLGVAGVTVVFIALASLYRILTLRQGGAAVAHMLGGREIDATTRDPLERRFRNLVEEMSLASGIPVPRIFVLDNEPAINAFAAGFSPTDAAVAVTRGALEQLNRDELQGVIAHEFSHVLNGDMRLNIRLMGVLFGIFAIYVVGLVLMRVRSGRKNEGAAVALFGLALVAIGLIGMLVGRVIQAAVSRQREYLADSSAVQFTRNPLGIAGALKKIGGLGDASYLKSPETTEVRHFLFGEGAPVMGLSGLMATHPPLADRISRIEGRKIQADQGGQGRAAVPGPAGAMGFAGAAGGGSAGGGSAGIPVDPASVVGRVGVLGDAEIAVGRQMFEDIPQDVHEALHTPEGAQAVVMAVLLDSDAQVRGRQIQVVRSQAGDEIANQADGIRQALGSSLASTRLALLELSFPALHVLDRRQTAVFRSVVDALIEADGRLDLFEFIAQRLVALRLAPRGKGTTSRARRAGNLPLDAVAGDAAVLLAALAHAGSPDDSEEAGRAFQAGARALGVSVPSSPGANRGSGVPATLGKALDRLEAARYPAKEKVLDAAAHCVMADGKVTVEESELLRLVAVSLDCPLPPFVGAPV